MTAVIANDTLEGMPQLGTDLGDFLGNLGPGLGKFLLIMAVFVGIGSIITAIVFCMIMAVKKMKRA